MSSINLPVVLVWRLGQTHLARLLGDSLSVGHDGVGLLERDLGVVLLQILEADLEMELASSGDDVLSGLLDDALHHGVGLGQPLETLDQLGQVSGVLALHGDSHDRRDGELHDLHVVGILEGGQGSGLDEELINTNETTDVTGGDILDSLNTSSHHKDGPLIK